MQEQFSDHGHFATRQAGRYLQQLCRHFAHKVDVSSDDTSGTARFPFGPATFTATPTELVIVVTAASDEGLETARRVIDNHLKTFAFREGFTAMNWAGRTGGRAV
ncbi:DUF2218 domain-containing protein [Thalassorhabdomicrobium marinisediminis]|uniref:DUF2218 domain-containing protein n=1 Tax=Thalassorhabdomicrobium marinisediminis TaxID=2170577 RepID=UPI002490554E|nr:DUF2218 domain-containing protein [Thalassorhabdomicrobium marinisediminis]